VLLEWAILNLYCCAKAPVTKSFLDQHLQLYFIVTYCVVFYIFFGYMITFFC